MKAKVALVDDDRNVLTSVSEALENEGYTVTTYSDGEEALAGMAADPVDVAVLDIKMPKMDGMELLRQIRKKSNLPVIFLTTKNEEIDELIGLQMGADDYITQPASQLPWGPVQSSWPMAIMKYQETNKIGPQNYDPIIMTWSGS